MKAGYLVSGLLGAAVGCVASYFILKKVFKEQADKEANEIIKYYKDKGYSPIKKKDEEEIEAENETVEETEKKVETPAQLHNHRIIEKMNYNSLSDKKTKDNNDISIITPEQYANDRSYDKVVLEYYTDDCQLADIQGERYDGDLPVDVVKNHLKDFGEYEDDMLYLRLEKISTDFEIARQDASLGDFLDED